MDRTWCVDNVRYFIFLFFTQITSVSVSQLYMRRVIDLTKSREQPVPELLGCKPMATDVWKVFFEYLFHHLLKRTCKFADCMAKRRRMFLEKQSGISIIEYFNNTERLHTAAVEYLTNTGNNRHYKDFLAQQGVISRYYDPRVIRNIINRCREIISARGSSTETIEMKLKNRAVVPQGDAMVIQTTTIHTNAGVTVDTSLQSKITVKEQIDSFFDSLASPSTPEQGEEDYKRPKGKRAFDNGSDTVSPADTSQEQGDNHEKDGEIFSPYCSLVDQVSSSSTDVLTDGEGSHSTGVHDHGQEPPPSSSLGINPHKERIGELKEQISVAIEEQESRKKQKSENDVLYSLLVSRDMYIAIQHTELQRLTTERLFLMSIISKLNQDLQEIRNPSK